MPVRFLLVIALSLGVAAGFVADALGFSRPFVQIATGIGFALLVAWPIWWSTHKNPSAQNKTDAQ